MQGTLNGRERNLAKIACAYGGLAWGLFWLPLRELDEAGIGGALATAVFYGVPLVLLLPLLFRRFRHFRATDLALHLTAVTAGVSMGLYALSFLFTDVVRAMLLYYMTPVWSGVLARIWLGEAITAARLLSFFLGFLGLGAILGVDMGIPLPRNAGDWMSLASGILWAVSAVMMRRGFRGGAIELTLAYFIYGSLFTFLLAAVLPAKAGEGLPQLVRLAGDLLWLVPVIGVLVIPAVYAVMWGSPKLNPGTVGILFMTEISVGAATAWLWAGEPFGLREITGVILITAAGLAETVAEFFQNGQATGSSIRKTGRRKG